MAPSKDLLFPSSDEVEDIVTRARQAEGTACLDDYGVWRVREEHLVPLSAPLPPDVYYVPPRYYPPPPYYAYYDDPFYYPYGSYYYGPSVSFGFV